MPSRWPPIQQGYEPFHMDACDVCSRIFLPPALALGAVEGAAMDDSARRLHKERLALLTREEGLTVTRSIADFQDAVRRGCPLCHEVAVADRTYRGGGRPCQGSQEDIDANEIPADLNDNEAQAASVAFLYRAEPESMPCWAYKRAPIVPGSQELSALSVRLPRWFNYSHNWFRYVLSAQEASPARGSIRWRPEYDAFRAIRRARAIAETCSREHQSCRQAEIPALPTRVVELDGSDHGTVRILVTAGRRGHFATLSYCWGFSAGRQLQASASAEGVFDVELLPNTIRDAIVVTRELGLRYLWVDSLCIIQDDDEDVAREVAFMDQIYGRAFITIAAARASHMDEGFLGPLVSGALYPKPQTEFRLFFPGLADNTLTVISCIPEKSSYRSREPLYLRGWVYQETLLSKRSIIFESCQVHFNCRCGTVPVGDSPTEYGPQNAYGFEEVEAAAAGDGPVRKKVLYRRWYSIVTEYSRLKLTLEEDRLPALAGIAMVFQRALGDTYLAGIWAETVPWALGWHFEEPGDQEPRQIIASWSWVSGARSLAFYGLIHNADKKTPTTLVDYDIRVCGDVAPLSKIKYGILKLQSKVREFDWDGSTLLFLFEWMKLRVYPDWRSTTITGAGGTKETFHMTEEAANVNKVARRMLLVPLGFEEPLEPPKGAIRPFTFLLLCHCNQGTGRFYRVGAAEVHNDYLEAKSSLNQKGEREVDYEPLLKFIDQWEDIIVEVE